MYLPAQVALDKAVLREIFQGNNIHSQDHLQKAGSAMRFVDIILRIDLALQLVKRARRDLFAPPKARPIAQVFATALAHAKISLNWLWARAFILSDCLVK